MIKTEIKIDGEVFTVRATSHQGLQDAIAAIKKAAKELKKQKKDEDDAISEE